MDKRFCFSIPINQANLNNDRFIYVGELEVDAVAKLHSDGTLRVIDIDCVKWVDIRTIEIVTSYICTCQPDTWETILKAAENNYRNT
jgi:hypothetical protein